MAAATRLAGALALVSGVLVPAAAGAQQHTFHLDRLEVPGAPDDGLVLFRPQTVKDGPAFYAQLGIGFALHPLRTSNIAADPQVLRSSPLAAIDTQFSTYVSAGFELLDRLTLGATFPAAWIESGSNPSYTGSPLAATGATTSFSTTGPAVGDTRLDARYVAYRDPDRTRALGLQLSVFAPTGGGSSTNFGGDGDGPTAMPMVTGEWTPPKWPTFVANLGVHFRPSNSINDPTGSHGPAQGLGVGNELRWALGALLPLSDGRFRVGVTFFGQTGLTGDGTQPTGSTFFKKQNTPIEYDVEGRMKLPLGNFVGTDRWFLGAGAGSRTFNAYGSPDFRIVVLLGSYWPIADTNPAQTGRLRVRESIRSSMKDTDGDGIPDDIDACPEVPEDHRDPDPSDGCPAPSDRDGDGIPDNYDQCPDQPEDKDGIDDSDGCPEDDADRDGIPDAKDACPKEPGQPSADPKKNGCPQFIRLEGSSVRVLQQVHFATGSATILPDSFPMLQEIVSLLKVTPGIKRMRVEGHTDNRGDAAMNLDLSKRRAASVRVWLAQHGIDPGRLESEGYGLTRPITSNDTADGRQANRRVEFKIVDEESKPKPESKPEAPPAPPPPKSPEPASAD